MKIPPPIVFITCLAMMWIIHWLASFAQIAIPYKIWPIALLILSAFIIAASAVYSFYRAKTTINPIDVDKATQLVTSGVFQISRNPMYLGLLLLLTAWGIYLFNLFAWLVPIGFYYYMTKIQIRREEEALTEIFGEAFINYCEQVRRWL